MNTPSSTPRKSGVRFALLNCLDGARVEEFHRWYDVYVNDCLTPGYLTNPRRYVNVAPAQGENAGFLAIYDTVTPDAGSAWPLTYEHINRLYPAYPEYIEVVLAGTYRALDSAAAELPGDAEQISVFMTDGPRSEFGDLIATEMGSDQQARDAIFELVEGFPDTPPRHLLIREVPDDPTVDLATRTSELATPRDHVRVAASYRRYAAP